MSILCSMVGASFTVAAAAEVLRSKKGITAVSVEVDTAQSQFGGASLGIGSGYLRIADHSSFSFGTNDFTIEFWFRPSQLDSTDIIWDQRPNGNQGLQPTIYTQNGQLFYYTNSGNRITGSNLATNTWYHIAVSRSGTSTRMFLNGTQAGSTYSDSNNYVSSSAGVWIGADQYFGGNNSVGHIDEVRISNSARYTTTFTPSTTPFVNDANTILLIHANGTDASTFFEDDNGVRSQKSVIAGGNGQIDTTQSKFGGSSYQGDGTGDYLSVQPLNDFAFGTGNFTIEFWFRSNGAITSNVLLLDARPTSSDGAYPAIYLPSSVPTYYVSSANRISGSTTLSTNTWYHLAISRSGTSTKMFLNGTQEGSTYTDTTTYLQPSLWIIGAQSYSLGTASWNGWFDEFRVSNSARYTANFTAPTAPFVNDANTILLIHADGTDGSTAFRDDNGALANRTEKYITAVGNAQVDTAQSQFGGSSLLLDGTGDYLTVSYTDNTTFEFTTGEDFTIECWFRGNSFNQFNGLVSLGSDRSGNEYILLIEQISGSNYLRAASHGGSNLSAGTTTISTNTWYHAAVTREGTTVKLFLNGNLEDTDTRTFTAGQQTTSLKIGSFGDGTLAFNGHIDEVRISNSARYTTTFTPSTTPFVNDANTLLLIHADGTDATTAFFDDTGSRRQVSVQAFGNAQISTAQSQFGGASSAFDGTGDFLTVTPRVNLTHTETWTIECWVRITSFPADGRAIVQSYNLGSPFNGFGLQLQASSYFKFWDGSSFRNFNSSIATGTWYHLAIVSTAGSVKMYQNGVEQTTTFTLTTAFNNTTNNFTIGAAYDGSLGFPGYIDELRISNSARYSANFTSPTAPFQNDANTLVLLHMDGTDASTAFFDDNGIAPYTP